MTLTSLLVWFVIRVAATAAVLALLGDLSWGLPGLAVIGMFVAQEVTDVFTYARAHRGA